MRGARSTLVLLVVALGLGAYIFFVERHRDPASAEDPKEQVFAFDAEAVTELQVTARSGEVSELRRSDDAWQLVAPIDAAADTSAVSSITSSLTSLEITRVVEEEAVDLEPFGLTAPAIVIGIKRADDDAYQQLLIGEQTPTGADRYAKLGEASRVFLIPSYVDTSFDKTTFDLRDKRILDIERTDLDELQLTVGDRTMRLTKEDTDWRMTVPWEARADFSTVEGLLGRLTSGEMQRIAQEDAAELEPYGLDEPTVTAELSDGSASATLLLGDAAPDGTRYARDAARTLVFTVEASLAADLERGASEYRRKDLFGFRPFNATRFQVDRPSGNVVFEKVEAIDPDRGADEGDDANQAEDAQGEQWRRIEPAPLEVDQTAMDDLLADFSTLRADSFVETRAEAGLTDATQVATVRVRYGDDDTEEAVVIWRVGDDAYAVADDEPGAAVVNATTVTDALDAVDALQTEP